MTVLSREIQISSLPDDIWPLLVMSVAQIPIGISAFGRAERYARQTGKLKRVG